MEKPLDILVVEDSQIAQVVIKAQLIKLGCLVDIASDGESALQKAELKPYDLILMDIGLGTGLDGFEVTTSIKNHGKMNNTTPVMAVTSHNEPEYNDKAAAIGMVGYFAKPFTPQDAQKILDYFTHED